jgi:predicted TPR repeat methyltransferase
MIETARRRGVYNRLSLASLEERLAASEAEFDLIAAADVLCYIGDLAPVMAALARALRPGGRAVFTLERSPGAAVELRPSLRFAHGEDHVRRVAEKAGLAVGRISLERLRTDASAPVEGLGVVLSRGANGAGPLAKSNPWATSTP